MSDSHITTPPAVEHPLSPGFKNLTGVIFGRLTVLYYVGRRRKRSAWLCQCGCGRRTVAVGFDLVRKDTKSCGCLQGVPAGGMGDSPEYSAWRDAKERTSNRNHSQYKNYGGRSIYMCSEWRNSFNSFYRDMGPRPKGMTLERLDNNGPYSKVNCSWEPMSRQIRNQRKRVNNTSGVVGVTWEADRGRWKVMLVHHQTNYNLGRFLDKTQAIRARLEAEVRVREWICPGNRYLLEQDEFRHFKDWTVDN